MRTHVLTWMAPQAPYMPVASVGLLAVVQRRDPGARLSWPTPDGSYQPPELTLGTQLTLEEIAEQVVDAPWPDLDSLPWPRPYGQAIKPSIEREEDPAGTWRTLAGHGSDGPPPSEPGLGAAQRLVAALLTDGVRDEKGLPGRSRLLRGVKADLSGVARAPRVTASGMLRELSDGPEWRSGSSGLGLGLAPEVHTFGGTTGPNPSSVGAYSPLLYRLCWLGVIEMQPFAVMRGSQRIVGGALFAGPDLMSWPVWRMPLGLPALLALFGISAIHAENPDRRMLRARGVDAVFRSRARALNTMISVFGWGNRVG